MTTIYFEELMAELGGHSEGSFAFAEKDGYPYSAEIGKTGEHPEIEFRFLLDGDTRGAVRALKEKKEPHCRWVSLSDAAGGIVGCLYTPPSDFYAKSGIVGLLAGAVGVFRAQNLAPPHNCPLCNLPNGDSYACFAGGYRETHAACLENRLALPEEDTVPPKKIKGNYATGILGALLGALVGALPNWATALSQGEVHFVLYAFIPLFSALLYRLFRGKARRSAAGLTVMLASLGCALLLELFWFWLTLTEGYGYRVDMFEAAGLYFSTHDFIMSIREMLLSLMFLLVGYFASTVLIRRYTQHSEVPGRIVRGSRFVRASAAPIGGDAASPPDAAQHTEGESRDG